ncbi:hypothetical protein [Flavipsychrobacter stenotrophus]|uniref:hypothetical protein n=1 Tax=Flavipsychrobacter stenotrophus TaxID=2077091 RepID=UPI0010574BE1|nr:hypothetical protein [Flavipsychrobacter stenotrophus]
MYENEIINGVLHCPDGSLVYLMYSSSTGRPGRLLSWTSSSWRRTLSWTSPRMVAVTKEERSACS